MVNDKKVPAFLLAVSLLFSAPAAVLASWEKGLEAQRQGDYPTALKEFREAAEAGDVRAFGKIGGAYLYGLGVPKDYIQAYAWFNLADAAGDEGAKQFRDGLSNLLTREELYQAEKLFADYQDRYLPEPAE